MPIRFKIPQPPDWLLKITADIKFHKYPGFIIFKPQINKVTGQEIREILNTIQPGDIILVRHDGYLSTLGIPGFWSHVGLYIGDNTVIDATGEGVQDRDILDFCRVDSFCICRLKDDIEFNGQTKKELVEYAIKYAINLEKNNVTYDYAFANGNNSVYCAELADEAYQNLFKLEYETIAGRNILSPHGIYESKYTEECLVFKH